MNTSNFGSLSSNLNPHLQFSSALNSALHNLKKPELRQIGIDLKIASNLLNQNKGALVEAIVQSIFKHPLFSSFLTRCDLIPFEQSPLLQKMLSEAMKKVTMQSPSYHGILPTSLEMYAHQPNLMQTIYRPTTSNFYSEMTQQQPQANHFISQMSQNICLSSSLMCKGGRTGIVLSCINSECHRKFHSECLKMPEKEAEKESKTFECPQCILDKNDPLSEVRSVVLAPFVVNPSEQKQFILNHFDLKAIAEDPDMGIEIKCIKLDYKYLNEQTWLDSGELLLNNRRINEFKPLQINSALKKRKDEKHFHRDNLNSINTIKFLDLKPSFDQKVNVRYEEGAVYMAAVYLVKRLKADELILKLQKNKVKDVEACKAQIMSTFEANSHISHEDCKISVDKVSISLLDTFFDKQMIQTPAKTIFCSHLQCFSLENLIKAMEIAIPRKWRCPICKVKAFDLIIDGYLWNIIKSLGRHVSASEVIFSDDGHYEVIKTEADSGNEDEEMKRFDSEVQKIEENTKKPEVSKKNSNKQVEIIILDEDDDVSGETLARSEVSKPNNLQKNVSITEEVKANVDKQINVSNNEKPAQVIEKPPIAIEQHPFVQNNNNQGNYYTLNEDKHLENVPLDIEVSINITHNEDLVLNEVSNHNISVEIDKFAPITTNNNIEAKEKNMESFAVEQSKYLVEEGQNQSIELENEKKSIMLSPIGSEKKNFLLVSEIISIPENERRIQQDMENKSANVSMHQEATINNLNQNDSFSTKGKQTALVQSIDLEKRLAIFAQEVERKKMMPIENVTIMETERRALTSPHTSIKSVDNLQKGVKEIQITSIQIDESPNFIKRSERNLAELQHNPNIRIFNLEDPSLSLPSLKPIEESKEIKPAKRSMEAIEQEFKEKMQNLLHHNSMKKVLPYSEFSKSQDPKEEDSSSVTNLNLASNLKTRTFIVKLYKKHFPEINKDAISRLPLNLQQNFNHNISHSTAMDISFPTPSSHLKTHQPHIGSNFNIMGQSFDLPTSSIFPLSMFSAAADKGLLGNSSNYLNFTLNPHNAMNLFEQGNAAFNNEFASQPTMMKNMNNSFIQNKSNSQTNQNKPMDRGSNINRPPKKTGVEAQKVSELKMKGFEANPICLDD